jgi:hypothetical protein
MKALTPKKAKQPKEEGGTPVQEPRPLWLDRFLGCSIYFLFQKFGLLVGYKGVFS